MAYDVALGPVYKKPSEVAAETGYVSVTDPSIPAAYGTTDTGQISDGPGARRYGGGYGGRSDAETLLREGRERAAKQAEAERKAREEERKAREERERILRIQKEKYASLRSQQDTIIRDYESKIRVQGRGVETGGRRYYGKAIVPETGGKTASQIQRETFQEARKKFGKDVPKGGYTAAFSKDYFTKEVSKEEIKEKILGSIGLPPRVSQSVYFPSAWKDSTKEVYNPKTGMYETARVDYGQGTREITKTRLPTPGEQREIDIKEGSPLFASTEKLKVDIKDIEKTTGRVRELGAKISFLDEKIEDSMKGKINEKGEFTGTEQEYKKYSTLVNRRNEVYDRYETATMKLRTTDRKLDFSFFGEKIPVKVSELSRKGIGFSIVSKYADIVPSEAARGVGRFAADVYPIGGQYFVRKPETVMDVEKGVYRLSTKVDVLAQREFAKGKIEEGVAGVFKPVFKMGTYFIPVVGAGVFASEVGESLSRYDYKPIEYIKAKPVEAGIVIGAGLLGGGMIARSLVKSSKIKSAVTKELVALEKTPLKSVTIYEEATGKIVAEGFRKTKTGYQKVTVTGRVEKTEKGFRFVPTGTGTSKIVGVATPEAKMVKFEVMKSVKGEPRLDVSVGKKKLELEKQIFVGGQTFKVGAKGTMIPRGRIGDLRFYETIGQTTAVPKRNIFGMVGVPEGERIGSALRKLKSQLRKPRELPPVRKEFKIPTGRPDYVQVKDLVGLKYSPGEVGVVVKIPKPTKEVGVKGGGVPSSKEFLKSMYAPEKQVAIMKAVPKLEEVSRKGLEITGKTIKVEQETISGLPIGGSQFVGTGRYEQTIQTISPTFLEVQPQRVSVDVVSRVGSGVGMISVLKEVAKAKEKQKEIQLTKTFQEVRPAQKEVVKVKQVLRELLVSKTKQIQEQRLLERQLQKPFQPTIPRLKVPKVPKILKPEAPLLKRLVKRVEEGGFEAVGFRFGKEISLLKGTKEQAAKKLEKFLSGTLGASGFLKRVTGEKLKAEETGLLKAGVYRKSKVSPSLVVEEKFKRLRKGGTGKDIQYFRTKGKKSRKKRSQFF